MNRFRKVGEDGALLADDATEWVAVLDTATSLMWTVEQSEELPWQKACEFPATLSTAGFRDWRMPTVEELFLLADREMLGPSIDWTYFPKCKVGDFWTGTQVALSGASYNAWYVEFDLGAADWCAYDELGYVRAVRAR